MGELVHGIRGSGDVDDARVVLAEVVRSGFVEGRHRGVLVALAADGAVAHALGDVEATILPRSCNKPIQAVAMLRAGLELPTELLALACSSHSGEDFHLAGVRRILASAGLDESALQAPPDWPMEERVKEEWIAAGGSRLPIVMNCSGKHAAMLLTCVRNGWSIDDYLDVDHPLQQLMAETFADLTDSPVGAWAVDGCGAPLLGTSPLGLARALARIATAPPSTHEGRVAAAMRAHPEMVSGTTRPELMLHRAVPGLVGKIGAEAVLVVALDDGRAVALKVDDGAMRVPVPVMVAELARLGVWSEPGVDAAALEAAGRVTFMGGVAVVGGIRPTID